MYVGVGAGTKPETNSRQYEALVANKPIVPLDENIARRAGIIEGEHVASDTKPNLGIVDATVAATAMAHNEAVVSDDKSDFETIDGLQFESVT